MYLSTETLEQLRIIINGDDTGNYRNGMQLVEFFNKLGFQEEYGQGFPSRWRYTDEKLKEINGKPELLACIRNTFAVRNYIEYIDYLDKLIDKFNQYLMFDKWRVIRDNDKIEFEQLEEVIIPNQRQSSAKTKADEFLQHSFIFDVDAIELDLLMKESIKSRLNEVEICVNNNAPLASIFMIGSIMEGLLLAMASKYPKQYNQANAAPKGDSGDIRPFRDWTLNNLIDVSAEIGLLKHDVKKFSHVVRDFRNYIHPTSQIKSEFFPDNDTAKICFQVLKAALSQIEVFQKEKQEEQTDG